MKKGKLSVIAKKVLSWIQNNKPIFILFIFAAIVHLSVVVFNGIHVCIKRSCGIYIGGLHFHDSLWHLALANVAFEKIPFQLPIYSGIPLQGYNYLLDLIMFLMRRLGIPAINSYFQVIPIVTLLSLFILTYTYAKKINKSKVFIFSYIFFFFFGSSFSYLLSLYHKGTLASYFYAMAMQSGRMFLNMQYAVSLIPFMLTLILLNRRNRNYKKSILIGLLIVVTVGLKIYGGIVLLFYVLLDYSIVFVHQKKIGQLVLHSLLILGLFLVSVFVFYNPISSSNTGSVFSYSPFALSRTMIEANDMFYMPKLVLARYYLQSVNLLSPRLLAIELFSVALFIFYNFGSRIFGLFNIVSLLIRRKIRRHDVVVLVTIIFSSCLTLLLVQKGDWWNVVQFFGYTLLLMNYFAAGFLTELFEKKKILPIIGGLIIIILTLPTNIEQIRFAFERQISISDGKLDVLKILKKYPEGTILVLPLQEDAYVSAFSHKAQYVADIKQLNLLGIDAELRLNQVSKPNTLIVPKNIKYIYIEKETNKHISPSLIKDFVKINETDEAILFMERK